MRRSCHGSPTLSGASVERAAVLHPVRLEARLSRREPARERAGRSRAGGGGVRAEADRERHRLVAALAVESGAGTLHDVPGCGRVVVAEVPVVLQVLPGIAGAAAVAARRRLERRRRRDRARACVVVGDELHVRADAEVVIAVVARRRIGEHVEPQRPAGQRLEADLDQHGRARRIRDPRLRQAPAGALGDLPELERPRHRLHARGHAGRERLDVARVVVDGLTLEQSLAVADGELQPAERRRAQVRVVDLAQ